MNLLKETIFCISAHGQAPENIIFIGSEQSGYQCSWERFKELANVEYDDGYGAQKVAYDLIIVFNNGARMQREAYDGAEAWQFIQTFRVPPVYKNINRLIVQDTQVGWKTLAEINEEMGE